jgi:hypothetical protein
VKLVEEIQNEIVVAGLEVLRAVVMKCPIVWDILPCSPLKVHRIFGGTYRLHLQGRRRREGRKQYEAGKKQRLYFLLGLFLGSEDGGMFLRNVS